MQLVTNDFQDGNEKIIANCAECENQVRCYEDMNNDSTLGSLFIGEEILGKLINCRMRAICKIENNSLVKLALIKAIETGMISGNALARVQRVHKPADL